MDVRIRQAGYPDIELLMEWRMMVLREVFMVSDSRVLDGLERANRDYYESALGAGGHIACFAYMWDEVVGGGGVCIYQEMPSPDNVSGLCAYLMNIYTCRQFRRQGIGRRVVQWLVGQAARRGITKIYLEASKDGRGLYEGMGFRDMEDMMGLSADERA